MVKFTEQLQRSKLGQTVLELGTQAEKHILIIGNSDVSIAEVGHLFLPWSPLTSQNSLKCYETSCYRSFPMKIVAHTQENVPVPKGDS